MHGTYIVGGDLIDGTGAPARPADLVVREGRIAEVLPPGGLGNTPGAERIDARGLCVAPGFIDIHSHSDFTLLVDPRAASAIAQGVTLEVIGNCGYGCAPLGGPGPDSANIYGYRPEVALAWRGTAGYFAHLAAVRPAVNVAALVPNGKLRLAAIGAENRPAALSELAAMGRLLEEGLEAGAFGYSTGLEYGPERACSEEELIALCRIVAARGGLYATHTRNQSGRAEAAIAEAIRTAAAAAVPLQISHISSVARLEADGRRAIERALEQVDAALRRSQPVGFDMHTRHFGTTTLSAALPTWVLAGDGADLVARLNSERLRRELREQSSIVTRLARGDWSRVVLLNCRARPEYAGRSIAELAGQWQCEPLDAILSVLRDEAGQIHTPMVAAFVYDPADADLVYHHPECLIGSDATTLCPDGPLADAIFHGAYTWAAWFVRRFVRDTGLLTLEAAVQRLTGLPAARLGLTARGVIRPGAWADLAIFDPNAFAERGTLEAPNQLASGMHHVLVNGVITMRDGAPTGARAGRVLRRDEET
jgi:N-acyl-D-aspartate/D-glutamate deacylase